MAGSSSDGDHLASTLRSVWGSGLPVGERRRLCRVAVAASAGGVAAGQFDITSAEQKQEEQQKGKDKSVEGYIQGIFELCLSAVGSSARLAYRPGISEAKTILRNFDVQNEEQRTRGAKFASRSSKLSSLRNSATHDGMGLALVQ